MRDGFTGQITTLSDEDRPIFEKFKSDFIRDLAPKTVIELSLASSIAWDSWRLNHLRAVEMNIYALGASNNSVEVEADDPQIHTAISGAVTFVDEAKRFALMSMYEQRMNRGIHKNLATLRQLQAERKQNYERDLEEEIIFARASGIKGLPYEAPPAPTENGSVFSNREIFAAAHRLTALHAARITVNTANFKVQFAGAASGTSSTVAEWPKPEAA